MGLLSKISGMFDGPKGTFPDGSVVHAHTRRAGDDRSSDRFAASATVEAPAVTFSFTTNNTVHTVVVVTDVEDTLRDHPESEPFGRLEDWEYAATLDRPLTEIQRETPWLTHAVATALCTLPLELFLDRVDPAQASDRLTSICVEAGLIGEEQVEKDGAP